MSVITDERLLAQLTQGDTVSFETLFYRHYDRIYGVLFRLVGTRGEAEDLLQEVFFKLHQNPPRGRQEHNVGAWLYRVATNLGYNHIRGRKRRWQRNRFLVPDEHDPQHNPAQTAEKREEARRIRATLAQLSQRQVQLLLLRQMDMSYAELAVACDVAPGSVGTLLARAAAAFRKAYAKTETEANHV